MSHAKYASGPAAGAASASPSAPPLARPAVIEVAAGLVFRDHKLLLTRRRHGDHLGGLWEFPGGKREPGETFAECLRRELREELGVDAEVEECVERIAHEYPEKKVYLEFYRCRLRAGEPQPLGCAALTWIERSELGRYDFPAADARLLEQLKANTAWWA